MHLFAPSAPLNEPVIRFEDILAPLEPSMSALEDFLLKQIPEFEKEVQPLARYTFGHSGKKLRPILVFFAGMEAEQVAGEDLLRAAAIVELVHLATLVHDDILDEASMRHRSETVVARYGPHLAVLLGDALFAHALHLASLFPTVDVCRAVSLATRQVCSGEIAQTFSRADALPTLEAYYRMIDLKTAELFSVSAFLGGFLAGLPERQQASLRRYARHLGIAYQIYDDAADLFGAESRAGKTLGTDLATGKFTLPLLIWLNRLPAQQRELRRIEILDGSLSLQALQTQLLNEGILESVSAAFHEQLQSATAALQELPLSPRPARLKQLVDFLSGAWNKFCVQ